MPAGAPAAAAPQVCRVFKCCASLLFAQCLHSRLRLFYTHVLASCNTLVTILKCLSSQGLGDGAYTPLKGVRRVVAVVGTAHVRGMVREWQAAIEEKTWEEGGIKDLLKC